MYCGGETNMRKPRSMKRFLKKANYRFQKDKRQNGFVSEIEEYLLNVLRTNPDDLKSSDEKEIYCSNIFEEIAGKEVEVSCSRIGSTAMEKLLPIADKKILLRLAHLFSLDLRSLFQDKYASHVLQCFITVISTCDQGNQDSCEARLHSWQLEVSQYAVNNLEEFMHNTYANHVLREILLCASGLKSQQGNKSRATKTPVEPKLATLVQNCAEKIMLLRNIADFLCDNLTSGLLQACLRSLHAVNSKQGRQMAKELLKLFPPIPPTSEGDLPALYARDSASRLFDTIIEVSSKKLRVKLHGEYFQNNMEAFSLAPNANFCVQNFISQCTDNALFESMFDELSKHLEAVLIKRHTGVVLALAKGCERLRIRQGAFMKVLQEVLHCPDDAPEHLYVLLVLQLLPMEAWKRRSEAENEAKKEQDKRLSITLQGSLIVQTMLNFNKPVKVVRSILALEQSLLEAILCDPRGSHVADAFVKGQAVGEKSSERLLLNLVGCMVRLAVSPHGGRSLEALFNKVPVKMRRRVAEELSSNLALISGCQCGSFLIAKFELELFRRNRDQWEKVQTQKKKPLLLEETSEPAKKKKKKDN